MADKVNPSYPDVFSKLLKVGYCGLVYQIPYVRGTFGPNIFGGLNSIRPQKQF